jgi:hypothetical protein
MLELRPSTRDEARPFIREHHRHHGVPIGYIWAQAVHDDEGGCAASRHVAGRWRAGSTMASRWR